MTNSSATTSPSAAAWVAATATSRLIRAWRTSSDFFTPDKVVDVAKAVLTIHRDFGDRTDRKHARLKYVVAERGVKFMQDEVNQRAGITLAPAKPYKFTTTGDFFGWQQGRGRKMVSRLVRRNRPRQGCDGHN